MSSFLDQSNNIDYDLYLSDLTPETVRQISAAQNEPERMLDHRLKCLEVFFEKSGVSKVAAQSTVIAKTPMLRGTKQSTSDSQNMDCHASDTQGEARNDDTPFQGHNNFGLTRGPSLAGLDLSKIVRYARPRKDSKAIARDRNDVPAELKDKFEKLGIPEAERKYLAGAGGQMDSETIYHQIKEKWSKKGVIFEDMSQALQTHEELIRKHFMRLVPASDHVFAALHGAVWSGGTFIYVPPDVTVSDPLQAYFRMNTYGGGQFEHTLIIIDDDASSSYIEGCSAPKFDQASLHAGLVEIFIGKRAKMRYSSVENRSTNTYNLNTKRALVDDDGHIEWVSGNLGSNSTMLYPCSVLKGKNSTSDALGIVVAHDGQHQDVGNKVIHIGANTSSKIVSKSISKGNGEAIYRGLVKILPTAHNAINMTVCDGLMIDTNSVSKALPTIDVQNETAIVSHEASAGKINENDLFYLMSRGFNDAKATAMLVNGFLAEVTKKLPLEYAGELNKLIEMELEG